MADNGLISDVSDVPGYLARTFPTLTAPARAVGNAMRLPVDAGADLLKRGAHSALGLEEATPGEYSGVTAANIIKALQDLYAPIKGGMDKISTVGGDALDSVRQSLVENGARPAVAAPAKAAPSPKRADWEDTGVPMGAPAGLPAAKGTAVAAPGRRAGPQARAGGASVPPMPPASLPQPVAAPADAVGAFGGGAPEIQPSTLGDDFRKRSSELRREPKGDLTQGQKDALALEFWMGVMGKSAQPGSRFLGAFGEAGSETAKTARGQIDKNLSVDAATIDRDHKDLTTEMGFRDKDRDNDARSRTHQESVRHNKSTEKEAAARVELLRRQVEQGKWKVLDNGKTGTYVLFDQETGKTKDTGIKVAGKDNTPAEVKLLKALQADPSLLDIASRYNKGREGKSDETPEAKLLSEANKLAAASMGTLSVDQAIDQQLAAVKRLRGGGGESLPAGLPAGSKSVGTKDGKRVFETPDGKRVIEK